MVILGIDPGSVVTGYGVVEVCGSRLRRITEGRIRTDPGAPLPERLLTIHTGLLAVIEEHAPGEAAVEALFNAKNAHSSLVLGHARGVALLAVASRGLVVGEYSPREVKRAVTGNGAASKEQARFMVCRYLGLERAPASLDASDALAVALCHALRRSAPVLVPGGARA